MDDPRFGVKITIIDLGLSRMDATDDRGRITYWTPFEEEIFEGEGMSEPDMLVKGSSLHYRRLSIRHL